MPLIYLYQYYIGMAKTSALSGICRISENNWLDQTSKQVNGKVTGSFLPQNDGTLCQGCEPNYQTTYSCGDTDQEVSETRKDGLAVHFDCTKEDAVCRSGTLQLEKGGFLSFSMGGQGKWVQQYTPGIPTAAYSAAHSKYGGNTLVAGQSLRIGEFVGSPNGDAYLTVVKDGDKARLVVARRESACKKQWDSDLSYASENDAAGIYKLALGPTSTQYKGRVAYINNNNEREFYADDLEVAGSDKYYAAGNYAQPNVKPVRPITQAKTSKHCEEECNKIDECYGFVYDEQAETCDLKGSDMFPATLDRVAIADAHMFVRLKSATKTNTCSDQIAGTEGSNFNNLPEGRTITGVDQCNQALSIEKATANYELAQNSLNSELKSFAGSIADISGTREVLQTKINEGFTTSGMANRAYEKRYAETATRQRKAKLRQETINGMETSTGYDMVSSNYQLMVWTTIALLAVMGGIRASR